MIATKNYSTTPQLDAWFHCLNQVQKSSQKMAKHSLDFNTLWRLAMQAYPDEYAAVFGGANQTSEPDDDNVKAAQNLVSEVANRISAASGSGVRFGWNFVRTELPALYNRQLPKAERVLNRNNPKDAIQKEAARLIEQLAHKEEYLSGIPYRLAFIVVTNRETVLRDLASAKITPDEAFTREPGLRNRLT